MKKVIFLFSVMVISTALFAQSERYVSAMKKNILMLDSANIKNNFAELSNVFARIAEAEQTQWLPYYYASYTKVMSAFMEKDKTKVDAIADNAQELISKAETIAAKSNSEFEVIKSMIATAHMTVDPMSRFMTYGRASAASLESAKLLDPTNPRPVYLQGQSKFYTPENFGGGKDVAKPIFEKALEMFAAFHPANDLMPTWGKSATQYFLQQCN